MINFVQFQLYGVFVCVNSIVPYHDIDELLHDCSISIANAMEMLQSCIKPQQYVRPLWNKIQTVQLQCFM